tara:strand:- start:13 stop:192 length:180 start_codon:yes stop_codon:yes gene_type:complete
MERNTQFMIGGTAVLVASLIGAYFAWDKYSKKSVEEVPESTPENIKMVVSEISEDAKEK